VLLSGSSAISGGRPVVEEPGCENLAVVPGWGFGTRELGFDPFRCITWPLCVVGDEKRDDAERDPGNQIEALTNPDVRRRLESFRGEI
jgi:hypothetical protein